jgi:hypothetical protein
MDPLGLLLELDRRCRLVLRSSESSIRQQFADLHQEIDDLRHLHPNLTQKLEALYREVYPNRAITTVGLIGFAMERELLVPGSRTRMLLACERDVECQVAWRRYPQK